MISKNDFRLVLLVLAGLLTTFPVIAQNCTFYYPQTKGAEMVYKNFDKKGKPSGTVFQKVADYHTTATGAEATISVKSVDAKGKKAFESQLHVRCEAGIFYFDMNQYLNQQSMSAFKDMQVKVQTDNLEIPSKLSAGEKLKDGKMTVKVENNGVKMLTMEITITDRTVVDNEKITTEAGTFDCYKISQSIITKTPILIRSKDVEWLDPGVGMIKSENFSNKGKQLSTTVLAQINQ